MSNEIGYIEELFMRANAEIDVRNYTEAKNILEEILGIDPTYGRAYNHLAWIYSDILKVNEKAEPLYKLALKYSPTYGAAYMNYLYLMLDRNDLDGARQLIARARKVGEVDKGNLNYVTARVFELSGDLKSAYQYYKMARDLALNDSFLNFTSGELERIRKKLGKLKSAWAILFW